MLNWVPGFLSYSLKSWWYITLEKWDEQKDIIALTAFKSMSSLHSTTSPPGWVQRQHLLLPSVLYYPVNFLTAIKFEDVAWGKDWLHHELAERSACYPVALQLDYVSCIITTAVWRAHLCQQQRRSIFSWDRSRLTPVGPPWFSPGTWPYWMSSKSLAL